MSNYFCIAALMTGLCLAVPAVALESRVLPPSQAMTQSGEALALLPSGGVNLDELWLQSGGARLYQNTLVHPRQIRMGGASFVDPASVPVLFLQPTPATKRRTVSRASPQAKVSEKAQVVAPAGVGTTKLRTPKAAVSGGSGQIGTGASPAAKASAAPKAASSSLTENADFYTPLSTGASSREQAQASANGMGQAPASASMSSMGSAPISPMTTGSALAPAAAPAAASAALPSLPAQADAALGAPMPAAQPVRH